MRFTVSSTDLYAQLQMLAKVLPSKPIHEILKSFLFEVSDGRIRITAADEENRMSTTMGIADEFVEGSFAIPGVIILDALKELPEQPLTFDVNTDDLTVKVLYQNGIYNLVASNANEFPPIMDMDKNPSVITVDAPVLVDGLSRCLYAMGQDEIRPVMNGIYVDLTTECLALVSSDGHKLVRNRNYTVTAEAPIAFILPRKPATILKNVLTRDNYDVVIKFDEHVAMITYNGGVLYCKLIEGRYPNYNSIIPKNNPNHLTVDRKLLLSALRRVLPFAGSIQLVRFHLVEGMLELNAENIDFQTSAHEKVPCTYEGIAMNIGFKGGSFVEILSNLDSEEVELQLADPIRAGVILPLTQPENGEVIVLLMPILLND